jgi:subtilisin family serine protease
MHLRRRRLYGRALTVEPLEDRRLLSRDVELILGGPDEDFGLMARTITRAADLSRYSSEQLDAVDRWVVLNPALLNGANPGAASPSAVDGTLMTTTTTTTTPVGSWPFVAPNIVTNVASLPDVSSDFAIWTFPAELPWMTVAAQLEETAGPGHFYPLVPHRLQEKFIPNDPYFRDQWHLQELAPAWDTVRGRNVVIGIVDDGLQGSHPDLSQNFRADLSRDFVDGDNNVDPELIDEDTHGTAVAGVAAARGDNGIGVTGAAPLAQLAGLRILSNSTSPETGDAEEAAALSYRRDDIDIYNNSWGGNDGYLEGPGPLTLAAIQSGATSGRGGLGNIFVWAAGNGLEYEDDTNYDGYANSRHGIAVSAIDNAGRQSWYSEPGAPILVAASSAGDTIDILTTDITGGGGDNYVSGGSDDDSFPNLDYTNTFGGTSSSAPLVSGIIALMLEANPALTLRDVQHILVNTARQNHSSDSDWRTNGAGFLVNHKYGFGAIDAPAAVNLARSWPRVGPQNSGGTGVLLVNEQLRDDNPVGVTDTVNITTELGSIEWVEVVVTTNHPYAGDLEIVLTSPSGTRSVLAESHGDSTDYDHWTFTTARHWGESTSGAWSLRVADDAAEDVGTWVSWQLSFYTGPAPPPVAAADQAVTRPGIAVTIPVLANDAGQLDPASVRVTTPPANGSTAINTTTGAITYTPRAGFRGDDSFQYAVSNRGGVSSVPAIVRIAVNDPPQLAADSVSVPEDGQGLFNVLANDVDLDGTIDPLSVEIVTHPARGAASVDSSGRIAYTPAADFHGSDTLTYRARDDDGLIGGPVTVAITITGVNDAPIAVDDEFSAVAGGTTVLDVLGNDREIDGVLVAGSIQIVSAPQSGVATLDPATGRIHYRSDLTFRGGVTLTYRVRDNDGAQSNVATVRIERSTAPSALDDTVSILEDFPFAIAVLGNDFDVDGFIVPSSLVIVTPPANGRITVNYGAGSVVYIPTADYVGPDSFQYFVRDNAFAASNVARVSINVTEVNDGPRLAADVAGTDRGSEVLIDVLANDIDIDGMIDPTSVLIPFGGGPRHGQVTVKESSGDISYLPNPDFVGGDQFSYFVYDQDRGLSSEGIVRVRVGAPVSLRGRVFVDLDNDGLPGTAEAGIPDVQVVATLQGSEFQFSATAMTQSDGSFHFLDNPLAGTILPTGTYSLSQIHPGAFIDGRETGGNPSPTAASNDRFVGIALTEGLAAENFYFAERGLQAAFVPAFLSRRLYFASTARGLAGQLRLGEQSVLNLAEGEYWYTIDQKWDGELSIVARDLAGGGTTQIEVFDRQLRKVAHSVADGPSTRISYTPDVEGPYFLRVAGTSSQVRLEATLTEPPHVRGRLAVGNTAWSDAFRERLSGDDDPGGVPLADAASVLPWTRLDQIVATFDQDLFVHSGDLQVRSLSGAAVQFTAFGYDPATRTATWTLAEPLATNKYLVQFNSPAGPIDLHTGFGDATQLRLSVVPGDVTRDGSVGLRDLVALRNRTGAFATDAAFDPVYDLDGSGAIDNSDLTALARRMFTRAPAGEISGMASVADTAIESSAPAAVVAIVNDRRDAARPISTAPVLTTRVVRQAAAIDSALAVEETGDAPTVSTTRRPISVLRARRGERLPEVN